MPVIDASYFASPWLNVSAAAGGTLYQRKAVNPINSSLSSAVNIGKLVYDKTMLDVAGQVMRENPEHYYKFTLEGDSLKLDFKNLTGTSALQLQLLDESGNVLADSEGVSTQLTDYVKMLSSDGLELDPGTYYLRVSYSATSLRENPQQYSIDLYSGSHFNNSYQTVGLAQTSLKQKVAIDNTMVYATADAMFYTHEEYNKLDATAATAVTIGWISENKSALSLNSKLTQINYQQFYSFTLQKGNSLKMFFDNQTNTSGIRIQLMDQTGTYIYADNEGSASQKKAFENLTSSSGIEAKPGKYVVKITYGKSADRTKDQTYNFKLYSGESYSALYETTAYAESFDTAILNGTFQVAYTSKAAAAAALYSMSQDEMPDIMATLRELI